MDERDAIRARLKRRLALTAWEQAAQFAHSDEAKDKPLLTAGRLIDAGDRLAAIVKEEM